MSAAAPRGLQPVSGATHPLSAAPEPLEPHRPVPEPHRPVPEPLEPLRPVPEQLYPEPEPLRPVPDGTTGRHIPDSSSSGGGDKVGSLLLWKLIMVMLDWTFILMINAKFINAFIIYLFV